MDRDHGTVVAYAATTGITAQPGIFKLILHVSEGLAGLPEASTVLLRCRTNGDIGHFESVVKELAQSMGIDVRLYPPQDGDRAANFRRDYAMVDDADCVEAYFTDERVMDGGTGHLVEACLNRDKPVRAWRLTPEGRVERVGDNEPPVERRDQAW